MRDLSSVPSSVPRPFNWLIWWPPGLFGAFLILSDLRQLSGLRVGKEGLVIGRDFVNLWTGGRLALSGLQDRLYDNHAYMAWQASIFGTLDPHNYSYPPPSLFLALPFGTMPYVPALILWTLVGSAFFVWAARPYMSGTLPAMLAIATPAAFANIWCGHYGFVIGGLWLFFFRNIDRAPFKSGIIAGLMTIKPHLGLMIGATLIYRRISASIIVATAVAGALVLLSSLVFGFDLWRQWLIETSALQTRIMNAAGPKFYFFMMPSAYIALRGAPMALAATAQAGFAAAALWLTWKGRRADPQQFAFIGATATAIIMPYIFNYDLTVVSLGFAILLHGQWHRLTPLERIIAWYAFAAPLLVMVFNPIAPLSLIAGLIVQVRHARQSGHAITPAMSTIATDIGGKAAS